VFAEIVVGFENVRRSCKGAEDECCREGCWLRCSAPLGLRYEIARLLFVLEKANLHAVVYD
jgi:hypothetical protein